MKQAQPLNIQGSPGEKPLSAIPSSLDTLSPYIPANCPLVSSPIARYPPYDPLLVALPRQMSTLLVVPPRCESPLPETPSHSPLAMYPLSRYPTMPDTPSIDIPYTGCPPQWMSSSLERQCKRLAPQTQRRQRRRTPSHLLSMISAEVDREDSNHS